jgi:hypothetical protein
MLPFTVDQFFAVFVRYNAAIWPAQVAAYAAGVAALVLALRGGPSAGRWVASVLAAMWLWTGIGYHLLHFAPINPAAGLFGAAFALQGALFALAALRRRWLGFDAPVAGWRAGFGIFLAGYAGVLYPLLGRLMGHPWTEIPSFGVTPCPMTIFTFGLLLLARPKPPWWLLVVPAAWSVVGGSAAVLLAVPQDWMLLLGGLGATAALMRARTRPEPRAV